MAGTKYILEKIKLEGEFKELLVKSDAENVDVNYNGKDTTLAGALAEIFTSLTSLPTDAGIDSKISAAIDGLIGGAPETYDTLKTKLEGLPESITEATTQAAGLMSASDKTRLDGLRGVRYGAEPPDDMMDGELFVRVVSGE